MRNTDYNPIYAIGTADFARIRTSGCVYVDKTEYVWNMTRIKAPIFLSRPRRFGKSLLTDTLACYFKGRKELFDGLKIAEHEHEWTEYPVLHFDLSACKEGGVEDMVYSIARKIGEYEVEWGVDDINGKLGDRLIRLIQAAKARTGRNVVILIDEYDAPLNNNIDKPADFLAAIRSELRSFFGPIKSCESDIRFAFLTGITRYSQLGVFSELNNLCNISMDARYAGVCGITDDELQTVLRRDVELLAERLNLSVEEAYVKLKFQYDGYHFCDESPDMYSPFSLFRCLEAGKLANYWYGTATPTMLVKLLQSNNYSLDLSMLDGKRVSLERFDIPLEMADDAIPLLMQAGYLTIKCYNPEEDSYTIGIPNNDVRIGLSNNLLPILTQTPKGHNDDFIFDFRRAVRSDNMDAARDLLHAYLAGIPSTILLDKGEHTYHAIFYVLFTILGVPPQVENGCARGYSDMIFQSPTTIYCMEFKVDRSADVALRQIIDRGYMEPYATSGKRLVMIGVNFSTQERNITEWEEREFKPRWQA